MLPLAAPPPTIPSPLTEGGTPGKSLPELDEGESPTPPALSREESTELAAQAVAEFDDVILEEGRIRLSDQRAHSQLMEQLGAAYPRTYAGGWIVREPWSLFVRFTDSFPEEARAAANELGIEVTFQSNAKYTIDELQSQADRLAKALFDLGSEKVATGFYEPEQRIEGSAVPPAALRGLSDEELTSRLPPEFQSADFSIDFVSDLVVEEHHTYGGARINDPGGGRCTTGSTVQRITSGETGVVTAGHCDSMSEYQEYPQGGATYGTIRQFQHTGQYGDVEWHTTGHVEYDDYYVKSDGTREDTYDFVRSNGFAVNQLYCGYGRASARRCSVVFRTSYSVTSPDNIPIDRLIALDRLRSAPGDSGGPWFDNGIAAGIHYGNIEIQGTQRDLFSKVHLFDEALGIAIYLE